MRMFLYGAALLLAAAASTLVAFPATAADVFELEPDYVYGRNRKPHLGYRKPEVFDPLSDQLYQSGYRDFPPTAIPDELKQVDALTRTQKMGRIMVCADGWFFPFSRTVHKNEAPGIDIEIVQSIAKKHGWEVDISWVNMATRFGPGGPGGAYGRSIDRGICDIVTGLAETDDDHHRAGHKLVFSQPYMSTGFVLVTQGSARQLRTLDDVKAQHVRIGVPAYSPMHEYVQANGFEFVTFFQNYQVVDALIRGEIDAAMLWSGAISKARLEHPEAEFEMAKGYVPIPAMRWNSVWVIKEKETELKQFIDEAFAAMLKSGEIKRIVERYGVPFYPPFSAP
jgi:polar amino acid transport system substrate-binding protein